jgi:hypothetical protein
VILTGASAPNGDHVRSLPAAADAPRVYLGYMTETADVTNLRDHASLVTWPGSQALASLTSTPSLLQRTFIQRFSDRYGAPSTLAASAFDALALIHEAASASPSELDGGRLRLRLQATTFAGVVTRYTFSATRHIGFDRDDLALLRWDPRRSAPFVPARVGETAR